MSMLKDRWHREQRTTSQDVGEEEPLEDSVVMLSSLRVAVALGCTLALLAA